MINNSLLYFLVFNLFLVTNNVDTSRVTAHLLSKSESVYYLLICNVVLVIVIICKYSLFLSDFDQEEDITDQNPCIITKRQCIFYLIIINITLKSVKFRFREYLCIGKIFCTTLILLRIR